VGCVSSTKTKPNNQPARVLSGEAHGEQQARQLALLVGAAAAQRRRTEEPARRRSFTMPCMAQTWKLEVQQNPWMYVCCECALATGAMESSEMLQNLSTCHDAFG
jgi:hypothetical protein